MKHFIIFGPPGAGKGSQSVLLSEKYKLKHISTGDILREEIRKGSETGLKVKKILDSGTLVGDDIIIEIINGIISSSVDIPGFLYDGFPRTIQQSEALEGLLHKYGYKIDAVISLEVDEGVMIKRIKGRAIIEGRVDDAKEEIVHKRFQVYKEQTEPLIDIYKRKGIYYPFNGNCTIEENFSQICKFIDNH